MIKKKEEMNIGAVITKAGSSLRNKTGSWRTFRPVVDKQICIGCNRCWLFCPDCSIGVKEPSKKAEVNYDYCKGCGICAEVCPVKCIKMKREEK